MARRLRSAIGWVAAIGTLAVLLGVIVLGGLRVSIVGSGSMQPQFQRGDAVVYVGRDLRTPQVGDVLVFDAHLDDSTTIPIVHRWVDTRTGGGIVTKGDANPSHDPWTVTADEVRGTVVTALPLHVVRQRFVVPVAAAVLKFCVFLGIALAIADRPAREDDDEPEAASAAP